MFRKFSYWLSKSLALYDNALIKVTYMGHFLHAFIGKQDVLRHIVKAFKHAQMISLSQGFGLLPLVDAFAESVHLQLQDAGHQPVHPFDYLSESLASMGAQYSGFGDIAYIETEYFGGEGDQCAVVWRDKTIVFGPLSSDANTASTKTPISQALHLLGVQKGTEYDEFDALGLGRFRHTDRCVEKS
jgi:hypothetical protein